MKTGWLGAVVLVGIVVAARASAAGVEEKAKGKTEPKGVPLELVVKSKAPSYKLDLGGKTPAEYRKEVEAALAAGRPPLSPRVELELALRNTGKEEIQVRIGGTANVITLELKGPGALSAKTGGFQPRFVIASSTVRLEPGKSKVVATLHNLNYGLRNLTHRAYWTEPGTYTLTATYKTTVLPAPKDARTGPGGFAPVTVTSAPVTIKVEKK